MPVLAFWDRLPFSARLLATAALALLVAGAAMLYFSVQGEARDAANALKQRLDVELHTLPPSIGELAVIGDYTALHNSLKAHTQRAGVACLTFRDAANVALESENPPPPSHAPAWFGPWLALSDVQGFADITIGGRYYGQLEVELSAQPAINRAWDRLLQHLGILVLAIVLDFIGIWLVLRWGLKPLKALDEASLALAEGDLKRRITPSGSPELRHTINAFNRMADTVQESMHALSTSQVQLQCALRGADLGLWDWFVKTGEVTFDERWAAMLGYRHDEIEQDFATWEKLVHPEDLPKAVAALQTHMAGETAQYEAEVRMHAKSGDWRWVLTRGRVTERDAEGSPLRVSGTHLDITDRRGAQAEVERLAFFDPLTSLPNRRLMLDRLQQEIALARRNTSCGALLFIDLDHFKHINDARGHAVGDQLLQQVARRLQQQLREVDTVARLGGDEFVVLLPELSDEPTQAAAAARTVADKLRTALAEPYALEGGEHYLGVSIGVTLFPVAENDSCEILLRQADTAMYRAKEGGRNAVCFFEPHMQSAVEARLALETELREAVAREEFQLYLQAQHDAAGRLVGAEALLRWAHPVKGLVPPTAFIPLAEETGLIVALGNWVLRQGARLLKSLEDAGHDLRLSINVSPRQFHEADFVGQVHTVLAETGASPNRLVLEITEGMLLRDAGEAIARMTELEHLGVQFSIDDFGTGYSSLSYLKRLPLHELKIDRTFVADLPRDADDAALVETILLIARQMRLNVVAEGVETEAQFDWLKGKGCDGFQGYLLGRPIPQAEFVASLHQH